MKKQLRPEGREKISPEGEKKKRRVIFTVIYQTDSQSHVLWRGPQGKNFWQIFILNHHYKWVSIYSLVNNSHYRFHPSLPRHNTLQNLKWDKSNLKYFSFMSISNLITILSQGA